jgi:peptide subunit release factor RF-3
MKDSGHNSFADQTYKMLVVGVDSKLMTPCETSLKAPWPSP